MLEKGDLQIPQKKKFEKDDEIIIDFIHSYALTLSSVYGFDALSKQETNIKQIPLSGKKI